jgi:FAD-dependent urate hydroxylase
MTNRRALVIGGGVAGMASALAMKKAGQTPVVFESHERSADGIGSFLTLATNGLEALGAIDVDITRIGGFETPRMVLRLGDGAELTTLENGPDRAGRPAARTIRRADLYGALRTEAERRGIEVVYGRQLASADGSARGVRARFVDGTEAEGDLLVGADGLRSQVRAILDPKAPAARFVGLLNAAGYANGVRVRGEVGTIQMIFGKRCFFGYMPSPTGEVWWFANPARDHEPTREELSAIDDAAWRRELLETFDTDVPDIRTLIEATPDIYAGWPTYDFPRVPIWHRDRMLLIGDAAHAASPSSGQGASMAIEDGVVLGKILRDEPDTNAAFVRYEKARRARVERVVADGKRSGDGKTPGAFGRVIRDLALRVIFKALPKDGGRKWLFAEPMTWDAPTDRAA